MAANEKVLPLSKNEEEAKTLIQHLQRDINLLADGNRAAKKRALEKINKEIVEKTPSLSEQTLQIIFTDIQKPLLKLYSDQIDKCRELANKIVLRFLCKVADATTFLPNVIPTLVQRLGGQEIIEPVEEIRLLEVESLCQIVDFSKESIAVFINDLVQILICTLVDPFAEVRKASCTLTEKLAITIPETFYLQGESLITPLLKTVSHQHNKVRVACLKTIGITVKRTSGKTLDDVISHIAQRTFDQAGTVRMVVTEVIGDWMLNLRDRYSFFHKLLPLLLTGLEDEIEEIRSTSRAYFEQAGRQYEMENEDDFKDKETYKIKKHYEDYLDHPRPSLGCLSLVQQNFSKILPALIGDLKDWSIETRIKSAGLLFHLLYYAEDYITMHIQLLLQGLYVAAQDEDIRVVNKIKSSAELAGLYVEPDVYCKLILPELRKNSQQSVASTVGTLYILTCLVRGANPTLFSQHAKDICSTVATGDVCGSQSSSLHRRLLEFSKTVLDKWHCVTSQDCSYWVFFICIHVMSLTLEEAIGREAEAMLKKLAALEGHASEAGLFSQHCPGLLTSFKDTIQGWSGQSHEKYVFDTMLLRSKESLSSLLPVAIPMILDVVHGDRDPELQLKTFSLLSSVALQREGEEQSITSLRDFSLLLTKNGILPNCVWKAGRTASAVRSSAVSCLWTFLKSGILSPDQVNELMPDLQTQIIACLDDHSSTTRLVTSKVVLKLLSVCQGVYDVELLSALYPELLRRMDDSSDEVRIIAAKSFAAFFNSLPKDYDIELYKLHVQGIFKGLLIHLDDPSPEIQDPVFKSLKEGARLQPGWMMSLVNESKHKHRDPKYCDDLLNHCAFLLKKKK